MAIRYKSGIIIIIVVESLTACVFAHFICSLAHLSIQPSAFDATYEEEKNKEHKQKI